MRPKKETNFVAFKLMYIPPPGENPPPLVGFHQKLVVPPSTRYPLRNWLNTVVSKEESDIPNDYRINIWIKKIVSCNIELFTVYNIRFQRLLAVIGEEKIHWIYYILKPEYAMTDRGRRYKPVYACMDGVTALTLNYCGCCIGEQYLKFVESILNDQDPNCYLLS